jgi:DNA primase
MDYYFDALTADLDLASAKDKAEAVRRLGPLIAEFADRVQRTHYLQQLGRMIQVDERDLWQQIQVLVRSTSPGRGSPAQPSRPAMPAGSGQRGPRPPGKDGLSKPFGRDEYCLSIALVHPKLLAQADKILQDSLDSTLSSEDLSRSDDRAILDAWRQWLARFISLDGGFPDPRGEFYDTLDENLQHRVDTLVNFQRSLPPAPEEPAQSQIVEDIIKLRLHNLRRQIEELRFLHEDAQGSDDRDASKGYGQLTVELGAHIFRLEKALNTRSIAGRRRSQDAAVRVPFGEE